MILTLVSLKLPTYLSMQNNDIEKKPHINIKAFRCLLENIPIVHLSNVNP